MGATLEQIQTLGKISGPAEVPGACEVPAVGLSKPCGPCSAVLGARVHHILRAASESLRLRDRGRKGKKEEMGGGERACS